MTRTTNSAIILVWVIVATPLIFLSYGSDPDTGRLAEAANHIWQTLSYVKSRSLGFPLYEMLISPLVANGEWYFSNALSLLSGLCIVFMLLNFAQQGEFKHPFLVVIFIVFAPIFIKNSTSTMEYIIALAFLIWAYYSIISKKYYAAAIFIGIAAGFRPTSGLFIIPLMAYMWASRYAWQYIAKVYFIALAIGTAGYLPALLTYGLPVTPYLPLDFISWIKLASYLLISFFGAFASLLIFPFLVYTLIIRRNKLSPFDIFHLVNIVLWVSIFLSMPYESEHLLPILPSVALVIDRYASRRFFIVTSILVISYHVVQLGVFTGESGNKSVSLSIKDGYLIKDIEHRIFQTSVRDAVSIFQPVTPTVLTFGGTFISSAHSDWSYDRSQRIFSHNDKDLLILGKPTCQDLDNYSSAGYQVIVWNDMKSETFHCIDWRKDVKIIFNLDEYFGSQIQGKSITSE